MGGFFRENRPPFPLKKLLFKQKFFGGMGGHAARAGALIGALGYPSFNCREFRLVEKIDNSIISV
jgi:hypothetical protein